MEGYEKLGYMALNVTDVGRSRDFYEKQVQKQQAHVAEFAPKRVKLQAAVDEKQATYDAAQKVALDSKGQNTLARTASNWARP